MKRILSFAAAAVMALTALPFGSDSMHAGAATVFDDTSLTEYHIATVQDLVDFSKASQTYKDKAVYLDADIDMQDIAWEPKIFDGYFDGQYPF